MRLRAKLPLDRYVAGTLWIEDDTGITFGPVRARGEADNRNAASQDNIVEDPTKVGGDHPAGTYLATEVVIIPIPNDTYGPYFIRLDPQSGEAHEAKQNGRTGIGIHGGRLHPDGRLRETFGCLRIDDGNLLIIASMLRMEMARGRRVEYVCEVNDAA